MLKVRNPSNLELFIRAAHDEDSGVREAAVMVLGAIGGTAYIRALIERLHDDDQEVVRQAVVSLGSTGDLSCVSELIEILEGDGEVPETAANVLGSMKSRKARAAAHAWRKENGE
jgi:HEAT repeat protein